MKEKIIKVKEVIKERKWFYLVGYIVGYVVSLMASGIPNKLYLIPIKAWGFYMALLMGNALYYGGQPQHKRFMKFIKYFTIAMVIMIIFSWIRELFLKFGIDINFLL